MTADLTQSQTFATGRDEMHNGSRGAGTELKLTQNDKNIKSMAIKSMAVHGKNEQFWLFAPPKTAAWIRHWRCGWMSKVILAECSVCRWSNEWEYPCCYVTQMKMNDVFLPSECMFSVPLFSWINRDIPLLAASSFIVNCHSFCTPRHSLKIVISKWLSEIMCSVFSNFALKGSCVCSEMNWHNVFF